MKKSVKVTLIVAAALVGLGLCLGGGGAAVVSGFAPLPPFHPHHPESCV